MGRFPPEGKERRQAVRYLHFRMKDEPGYDAAVHIDVRDVRFRALLAEMPEDGEPPARKK